MVGSLWGVSSKNGQKYHLNMLQSRGLTYLFFGCDTKVSIHLEKSSGDHANGRINDFTLIYSILNLKETNSLKVVLPPNTAKCLHQQVENRTPLLV